MFGKTAVLVGIMSCAAVAAYAAPEEVLDKSVRISFSTTIPARGPGGMIAPRVFETTYEIYIDRQGRILSRMSRNPALSSSGGSESEGPKHKFEFEGPKLIGSLVHFNGAAQLVATFEPGGVRCHASFVSHRENSGPFRFKGAGGAIFEATGPATHNNINCSVASGNLYSE